MNDAEGEETEKEPPLTAASITHVVTTQKISSDSIYNISSLDDKEKLLKDAFTDVTQAQSDWNMRDSNMKLLKSNMRRHQTAWHQKLTLSLACMIFLFIGVSLGGIIRKGGLGMPVVVSVLIFIFYYVVNNTGMKMAKEGQWYIWSGMWLSTAVLAPIGGYLTYKSNNDSVVLNFDALIGWGKKFLGIRSKRNLARKEVIIEDPCYETLPERLQTLSDRCTAYMQRQQLPKAPNYYKLWTSNEQDEEVSALNDQLEELIEEMSNTRSAHLLNELNNYPVLSTEAVKSPFKRRWLNFVCGLFFPLGIFLYIRIWIFRWRLLKDLERVIDVNQHAIYVIDTKIEH